MAEPKEIKIQSSNLSTFQTLVANGNSQFVSFVGQMIKKKKEKEKKKKSNQNHTSFIIILIMPLLTRHTIFF